MATIWCVHICFWATFIRYWAILSVVPLQNQQKSHPTDFRLAPGLYIANNNTIFLKWVVEPSTSCRVLVLFVFGIFAVRKLSGELGSCSDSENAVAPVPYSQLAHCLGKIIKSWVIVKSGVLIQSGYLQKSISLADSSPKIQILYNSLEHSQNTIYSSNSSNC